LHSRNTTLAQFCQLGSAIQRNYIGNFPHIRDISYLNEFRRHSTYVTEQQNEDV